MKTHFLFLLLATACNRAPEMPKGPVPSELGTLTAKPKPALEDEALDGVEESLDRDRKVESPDEGVMLADGGAPTPPPTPQQRADYRAQLALAARTNKTDSVTITERDPRTGQFVQRRVAVQQTVTSEDDTLALETAYTVIVEKSRARFLQKVNQRLETGFYLRGPMRTERTGPASFVYLQDMVRHRAGAAE